MTIGGVRLPSTTRGRTAGGGLVALAVLALVVLVTFELLPDLFAPGRHAGFGPKDVEDAREAVRTSGLQFVGGVVLVVGAVLTALNLRQTRLRDEEQRRANEERALIDREGQLTERFTRARRRKARTVRRRTSKRPSPCSAGGTGSTSRSGPRSA